MSGLWFPSALLLAGLTSAQELSLRHLQLTLVAIDPQIVSQTFIETNFDVDRTQEQLMIYHWDDFMLSLEAGMAADAEWDDEGPFGTSLEDPAPVLPVNANARRTDSRGSARRAEKATATASSLRSGSSSTEWDSVTKPSNHNELVKQAQIFRDLGVLAFKDMRATFQRAAEASSSGAPRPDLWEKGRDLQRRHKNLQWQAAHVYLRAHNDPRHVAFEFAPSPAKGCVRKWKHGWCSDCSGHAAFCTRLPSLLPAFLGAVLKPHGKCHPGKTPPSPSSPCTARTRSCWTCTTYL